MNPSQEKFETKKNRTQPHDRLVKRLLSDPAVTKDILKLYLPEEVRRLVNLEDLTLQRDSFIDDEHRAFAVDLLFKTKIREEAGYIWVLLEHQSTSDPWLPVRIFKYIGTIWEHLRKLSKNQKIPLIYPIIIYNGERKYSHTLTLKEMIEPEVSKEVFDNLFKTPFCLIDLSTIEDEELRSHTQNSVRGIALLMTLKHIRDKTLQTYFERDLMSVFKLLEKTSGGSDEAADLLYYLVKTAKFLNKEKFWLILHKDFSSEVEDKVMTIAEQLRAEGMQKGIEKGREEERLAVARNLLLERVSPDLIARTTHLSLARIKELQQDTDTTYNNRI